MTLSFAVLTVGEFKYARLNISWISMKVHLTVDFEDVSVEISDFSSLRDDVDVGWHDVCFITPTVLQVTHVKEWFPHTTLFG